MQRIADKMRLMPKLRMMEVKRAAEAWTTKNPDKKFVGFLVGDTLYPAAQYVAQAAAKSALTESHKYSNPAGDPKLLVAIAKDFERLGISGLDPHKNICVTNGTMEALQLAALTLINPKDEVILAEPYYFLYPFHVFAAGGEVRSIATTPEHGFKMTPQELSETITDKTKYIILNTPLNPVGSFYSKQELQDIAAELIKHPNVIILCDEIYERFFIEEEHVSLWSVAPNLRDRILVMNHFSKPWGMSGLRVGWIAGPEDLISAIITLKAPMSWNTNTVGQAAAYTALTDTENCAKEMELLTARLRSARNLMRDRLAFMGFDFVPAKAGMFIFPKVPDSLKIPALGLADEESLTRAERFAHYLIPFGTTVAPGIDMGRSVSNYFRLLFAMDEQKITQGMASLDLALKSI